MLWIVFFIKINVSHFSYFHTFFYTIFAAHGQSVVILLLSGSMNIHRLFVRIEEINFVLNHSGTPGCCRFILRPHQSESNPFMQLCPLRPLFSHQPPSSPLSPNPRGLPQVSCLPVPSWASFYQYSCCSSLLVWPLLKHLRISICFRLLRITRVTKCYSFWKLNQIFLRDFSVFPPELPH